MRLGPLAALSVTTLLAVGIALAVSVGAAKNDGPAISKITYIREVEHGQPERLGDCPLSQWVTVERDGRLRSIWYFQRRQNNLCVPVSDFEDGSPASDPGAHDLAARSSIRLTSVQIGRLRDAMERLRWNPEWGSLDDIRFPLSMSSGCKNAPPRSGINPGNNDTRLLVIERTDKTAAALSFGSGPEALRAGGDCRDAQSSNVTLIDAVLVPHVESTPGAIYFPPNLSELLRPRSIHLTD